MIKLYILVFAVFSCFTASAQLRSRLVAFAKYGADTTIACVDSGGYNHYTRNRGGGMNPQTPYFLEEDPFLLYAPTDFETGNYGLTQFDSAWETGRGDTDISTQVFDENDNIIYSFCQIFTDGSWQKYADFIYTYDANNNLLKQIDTTWTLGKWSYIQLDSYIYDQKDRIISTLQLSRYETDSTWFLGSVSQFNYDISGKLISTVYKNWDAPNDSFSNLGKINFYYTGDKLDSFAQLAYEPSFGYFPSKYGYYYFSPANDTMILNYVLDTNFMRVTNTYDQYHNKTSSTTLVFSTVFAGGRNPGRVTWAYNSYNQVTTERNYNIDASGNFVFSGLTRFYYETYAPEVPFSLNNLLIFPSPTTNTLTIKLEWDQPRSFTVAIFDVLGRRIMQWDEPVFQKYEKTITLPDLAAGNYFIRVSSGKQRFVKQFVVLH